jgi:plasmid stability protein
MNAINIRIEDEALVSGLSRLANVHRRSVEAEALEIIRSAIAEDFRFSRRSVADRIAAMTPKNLTQTDSTDLLREDRDRDE